MGDDSLQSKAHWGSSKVQAVPHLNQAFEFELEGGCHK